MKSSTKKRANGAAKQARGAVKETAGKAVGSPGLEYEGKVERVLGKAQRAAGDFEDDIRDALNKTSAELDDDRDDGTPSDPKVSPHRQLHDDN
jgi:uncharacterized protein YjbJ (UPF0337 family)